MDGKRGAQRRPLSELDAEQVAERSVQGDVVDEVCRPPRPAAPPPATRDDSHICP